MPRYDAFLSYSHAADGRFGPRLQTLLEGFARSGPRRALRIFRDEQNLAADPDLWGSIEEALTTSEWFVLLASPTASRSPWVDKEVAWWLGHRSADRLIVALTEPAENDELPLPPALRTPGAPRPAVVDLTGISRSTRLDEQGPLVQRKIAELAAAVHGRSVPDLIAADAAYRRRQRFKAVAAAVTLAVLIALVGTAGVGATRQTARAEAATQEATAHLLATTALATSATDLERAALLAVEGYRLHPDTQTLTALLRSVSGTSPIGPRTAVDDEVMVASAAPSAGALVIGTETGEILRWDLRGDPVRLATLDARPNALATNQDGTVVAVATSGTDAAVWVYSGGSARKVQTGEATDVAVDPSGDRFAIVRWQTAKHDVSVHTTADDAVVGRADLAQTAYDAVRLQGDAVVLHQRWTNRGLGPWQRRSLPDLDVLDEGTVLDDELAEDVGSDVATAQATTPDGHWVLTHLDDAVHAMRTTDGATVSAPVPTALGTFPPAVMALSPSGSHVLLSRRDEVWIVRLPVSGTDRAERLEGVGTPDGAVFLSDGLLVMTHERTLTAWDVGSGEALAETTLNPEEIPRDKALTPDGTTVVSAGELPGATAGEESRLIAMTHTFDTSAGTGTGLDTDALHLRRAPAQLLGELLGPAGSRLLPVPLVDGTHLFVGAGSGAVYEAAGTPVPWGADPVGEADLPPLELRYETGLDWVRDAAVGQDGQLVLAAADGTVQVRDPLTGELRHETEAPAEPGTETRGAQISPDGRFVAFHDVHTSDPTSRSALIRVVEVATSTVRTQKLTAGRLTSRANDRLWQWPVELAFGGDYLAAAHAGGIAVLDRDGGSVRRQISAPTSGRQNAVAPVPGTTLVAVAGDADWIRLFDTATGEEVADLSALAGAADGDAPLWLAAGPDTLWAVGASYTTRWDVRPERLHAQACDFAARNLTVDEWRQAAGDAAPPRDLTCTRPLEAR
jgi:WD40 repeat protein